MAPAPHLPAGGVRGREAGGWQDNTTLWGNLSALIFGDHRPFLIPSEPVFCWSGHRSIPMNIFYY